MTARDDFVSKLKEIGGLFRELRTLPLPDFWQDSTCCDNQTLVVVEPGYWRFEDVDDAGYDTDRGRVFHASTDGWDSMSETGALTYIECRECGNLWEAPTELEWD